MVQEPVEDGRGEDFVSEHLPPFAEGSDTALIDAATMSTGGKRRQTGRERTFFSTASSSWSRRPRGPAPDNRTGDQDHAATRRTGDASADWARALADRRPHLLTHRTAPHRGFLLIRPDGHIAASGTGRADRDAVTRLLDVLDGTGTGMGDAEGDRGMRGAACP